MAVAALLRPLGFFTYTCLWQCAEGLQSLLWVSPLLEPMLISDHNPLRVLIEDVETNWFLVSTLVYFLGLSKIAWVFFFVLVDFDVILNTTFSPFLCFNSKLTF